MSTYYRGELARDIMAEQEARYRENHRYDYIIIGSGMSALCVGTLLAKAGAKICMIEAHDIPGGNAHSFEIDGFQYSAQEHYIWGCEPGGTVYQFLKHLNLQDEILFEKFDAQGYDHIVLPDGKRIKVPYGFDNLIQNIDAAYPGQKPQLQKFISIIEALNQKILQLPHCDKWWQYLTNGEATEIFQQHKDNTLQEVLDECQLNQEIQAVLTANSGNYGAPPEVLSILGYASLVAGCNQGAYYPRKHFKFLMDRLTQFIEAQPGCHLYFKTMITHIDVQDDQVTKVMTADGKVFIADNYICNMDPQQAAQIIGWENIPDDYQYELAYHYSPSAFLTYVGVEGIDLRDYEFGNHNIWHIEQWDMNKTWREQMEGHHDHPWLFISTPSLRTPDTSTTPEGCQNMKFGTLTSYQAFKKLYQEDPSLYKLAKKQLRDQFLDIIEQRYIPNFRQHIRSVITGTPLTNEYFVHAPFGACYGSMVNPENMGQSRLSSTTPWKNLFWCDASSGCPGIYGTTLTGSMLYQELTGDHSVHEGP